MKYIVYGKPNCHYCEKVKTLLTNRGYQFVYKEIKEKGDSIHQELLALCPETTTVPQIFYHIGGFTDLKEFEE